MVIYPASFVLSAEAAGAALIYPRICWQTFTRESNVIASSSGDTDEGPDDMPLSPETATYWLADTLPAWWMIDLGETRSVDYVGIAEHTIGSNGCAVEVETSMGDTVGSPPVQVWTALGGSVSPADDSPLLFLDTARNARYVRVSITGSVVPRVAVVYTGIALAMPMTPQMGYPPITLNRRTQLHNSMSRGGQFLGQGFKQLGVESSVTFQRLQQDWYEDTFDLFVKSARQYPYFFAENPERYPLRVAYAWTREDIRPSYAEWDYFSVSWPMEGIGNE